MNVRIAQFTDLSNAGALRDLTRLLCGAVNEGAAIGFLAPLDHDAAAAYWSSMAGRLTKDVRLVLAFDDAQQIVGTGQLVLPWQTNGRHRAEVAKLIVDSDYRGRGIGLAIIRALEQIAIVERRFLLVLNTRKDGYPVELYRRAGFVQSGEIPGYTCDASGSFQDTVLMHRWLPTTTW